MMDTTSIVLLVVTASISFGIGRVIMHVRKKKQAANKQFLAELAAKAARNAPPGPPSNNKSKRKRQQQEQLARAQADQKR
jgi:hypothetical protein